MSKLERKIYENDFSISGFSRYIGINRGTLFRMFKRRTARGDTIHRVAKGLCINYEDVLSLLKEE